MTHTILPTSLNLWVLANLAKRIEVTGPVSRVAPGEATHLRRCIKAGLLTPGRTLTLTPAGIAAIEPFRCACGAISTIENKPCRACCMARRHTEGR